MVLCAWAIPALPSELTIDANSLYWLAVQPDFAVVGRAIPITHRAANRTFACDELIATLSADIFTIFLTRNY